MSIPRVRDDEEIGATYRLDRLLGEGATSQVYLGVREGERGSAEVAVKIARRGMSATGVDAFWHELEILQSLAGSDARDYVPWAHRGVDQDVPEANCIIIEYVPDTYQLTRQVPTPGAPVPELLATKAGVQYARLLMTLHNLKIASYGDRKATDIRWDNSRSRLIVLDWNRARVIPNDTPQEIRDDLARQDLRVFGEIWSQLMLGQSLDEIPDVDDKTHPAWVRLSRGTRIILSRVRSSRSGWGYIHASELARELEAHARLLDLAATNQGDALLALARQRYQAAEDASQAEERTHLIEQVLVIGDLAVRVDPAHAQQLDPIYAWCRDQGTRALREARKTTDEIRRQLKRGYPEQALNIATQAARDIGPSGAERQAALLILGRWEQIVKAAVRGTDLQLPMDGIITPLIDAMVKAGVDDMVGQPAEPNALSAYLVNVNELLARLDEVTRGVHDGILSIIAVVRQEIAIRQGLAQAVQASADGDEDRSRQGFQQTAQLWQQLRQSNAIYAERLRLTLGPLEAQLQSESLSILQDAEVAKHKQQFERSRWAVLQALDAALIQRNWPANLGSHLNTAVDAFRELSQVGKPEPALALDYDAIRTLRDADNLIQDGRIEAAGDRVDQIEAHDYRERSLPCWQFAALGRMKQIMGQESLWPDELDRAAQLLTLCADRQPNSGDHQTAEEIAALSGAVGDKKKKLAELRARHSALVGDISLLVQEPHRDDVVIDEALQAAQEAKIELFDRPDPRDTATAERRRTAALLAARQTARLPRHLERVTAEIDKLCDRLQTKKTALEDSVTPLVTALQQFNGAAHFLTTPAHQRARERIEGELQALSVVNKQLQDAMQIVEQIPKQEASIQHYTSPEMTARLANYAAEAQPARLAMIDIWLSAGLQAARDLRLDGPDGVRACVSKVQNLTSDRAASPALQETLNLLDRSIEYLTSLEQRPDQWHALQSWREALLRPDRAASEQAWEAFMRLANADPNILDLWVIGEMRTEQIMLHRAMPRVPQQSNTDTHLQTMLDQPVTDSMQKTRTREQEELRNHILNQITLLEIVRQTDDRPERLGDVRAKLDQVSKQYDINDTEVVKRYNSLRGWCESRQQSKREIEDCEDMWRRCQNQLKSPSSQTLDYLMHALLPQTQRLVAFAPMDVPPLYWDKLHHRLKDAYDILAAGPKGVSIQLIIWIGMLYYRVRERTFQQPEIVKS